MLPSEGMSKRCRVVPLVAITLSYALLAACVATPDDVAQLDADHALDQRSTHGLVEATVALDGPQIARGPNDFSIALRAAQGSSSPLLTSVDASMAVHGHHVSASSIVTIDVGATGTIDATADRAFGVATGSGSIVQFDNAGRIDATVP